MLFNHVFVTFPIKIVFLVVLYSNKKCVFSYSITFSYDYFSLPARDCYTLLDYKYFKEGKTRKNRVFLVKLSKIPGTTDI